MATWLRNITVAVHILYNIPLSADQATGDHIQLVSDSIFHVFQVTDAKKDT